MSSHTIVKIFFIFSVLLSTLSCVVSKYIELPNLIYKSTYFQLSGLPGGLGKTVGKIGGEIAAETLPAAGKTLQKAATKALSQVAEDVMKEGTDALLPGLKKAASQVAMDVGKTTIQEGGKSGFKSVKAHFLKGKKGAVKTVDLVSVDSIGSQSLLKLTKTAGRKMKIEKAMIDSLRMNIQGLLKSIGLAVAQQPVIGARVAAAVAPRSVEHIPKTFKFLEDLSRVLKKSRDFSPPDIATNVRKIDIDSIADAEIKTAVRTARTDIAASVENIDNIANEVLSGKSVEEAATEFLDSIGTSVRRLEMTEDTIMRIKSQVPLDDEPTEFLLPATSSAVNFKPHIQKNVVKVEVHSLCSDVPEELSLAAGKINSAFEPDEQIAQFANSIRDVKAKTKERLKNWDAIERADSVDQDAIKLKKQDSAAASSDTGNSWDMLDEDLNVFDPLKKNKDIDEVGGVEFKRQDASVTASEPDLINFDVNVDAPAPHVTMPDVDAASAIGTVIVGKNKSPVKVLVIGCATGVVGTAILGGLAVGAYLLITDKSEQEAIAKTAGENLNDFTKVRYPISDDELDSDFDYSSPAKVKKNKKNKRNTTTTTTTPSTTTPSTYPENYFQNDEEDDDEDDDFEATTTTTTTSPKRSNKRTTTAAPKIDHHRSIAEQLFDLYIEGYHSTVAHDVLISFNVPPQKAWTMEKNSTQPVIIEWNLGVTPDKKSHLLPLKGRNNTVLVNNFSPNETYVVSAYAACVRLYDNETRQVFIQDVTILIARIRTTEFEIARSIDHIVHTPNVKPIVSATPAVTAAAATTITTSTYYAVR